jgi:hypothetical protein
MRVAAALQVGGVERHRAAAASRFLNPNIQVALNERIRRLNRTLGMVRVKKQPANAPGRQAHLAELCSEKSTPIPA